MTHIAYGASLALSAAILTSLTLPAEAVTFAVLYSFQHPCCGNPDGRLLLRSGSLFGTSAADGSGNGQVFKLKPSGGSWTEKTLLKFDGTDGANPDQGLIQDSTGALYGTTAGGGTYDNGTVFELALSGGAWTEKVLYSFTGGSDGAYPECDLVRDSSTGTLYGTANFGGDAASDGTVFSLTYSGGVWTEKVLHSFGGGGDGSGPYAGLHRDTAGALYGTTWLGGAYGSGTVFKMAQSGGVWTETVLHSFGGGGDGSYPYSALVEDSKGAFYGTTTQGGAYGDGTVFKLAQSGGVWTETVLWNFEGRGNRDGHLPRAGLHLDSTGALYGTTYYGGDNGYGTVFELAYSGGSWIETVLYSFAGSSDGSNPYAALIEDSAANLYGTAEQGGAYGHGTVFQITP